MQYQRIRKDRDSVMGFSVAPDEKQAIQDEARRRDLSVSDFCRMVLLDNVLDPAALEVEVEVEADV